MKLNITNLVCSCLVLFLAALVGTSAFQTAVAIVYGACVVSYVVQVETPAPPAPLLVNHFEVIQLSFGCIMLGASIAVMCQTLRVAALIPLEINQGSRIPRKISSSRSDVYSSAV